LGSLGFCDAICQEWYPLSFVRSFLLRTFFADFPENLADSARIVFRLIRKSSDFVRER